MPTKLTLLWERDGFGSYQAPSIYEDVGAFWQVFILDTGDWGLDFVSPAPFIRSRPIFRDLISGPYDCRTRATEYCQQFELYLAGHGTRPEGYTCD